MARIQLQYLFHDHPLPAGVAVSDYETLDFVSGGSKLYGALMWPDGTYTEPRPLVIIFHGYPGSAPNDDLAHALCRAGCVVCLPHHRGAWGSEGKYLESNNIADAVNLAEYFRGEGAAKYNIDPSAIFFAGHSMGGCTALNAGKTLPWLRGLIAFAPYDPTVPLRAGKPAELKALLAQGVILRSDGLDAIYNDIVAHSDWNFAQAADALAEQNVLFVTGTSDNCAPGGMMVAPLWEKLSVQKTTAVRHWHRYPTSHGLLGARTEFIGSVAQFINDVLSK